MVAHAGTPSTQEAETELKGQSQPGLLCVHDQLGLHSKILPLKSKPKQANSNKDKTLKKEKAGRQEIKQIHVLPTTIDKMNCSLEGFLVFIRVKEKSWELEIVLCDQ